MASRIQLDDVRESVTCGICIQLLTDARGLTCGHTYCLVCLRGYQKSSERKECPVCRAVTVPSKHDLDRLPTNKLATDLVKLVHSYEPSTKEEPAVWNNPSPRESEKKSPDSSARLAMLMSMLEGLGSDGGGDTDADGAPRHFSVTCDNCRKSGIVGSRFKCGICDDYDLCEKCEAEPRDRIHDPEHIFIKLKKARHSGPSGMRRVLHEDSTVMGMTQDKSKTEHALDVDDKKRIVTRCNNCNISPIKGTRYKCGICRDYDICETCEKTSEEIHDPKHIFLVLPHPVGWHTTEPQLIYSFYS